MLIDILQTSNLWPHHSVLFSVSGSWKVLLLDAQAQMVGADLCLQGGPRLSKLFLSRELRSEWELTEKVKTSVIFASLGTDWKGPCDLCLHMPPLYRQSESPPRRGVELRLENRLALRVVSVPLRCFREG